MGDLQTFAWFWRPRSRWNGEPDRQDGSLTALSGIQPEWHLPVLPDVGTDREERLAGPFISAGAIHERAGRLVIKAVKLRESCGLFQGRF